MKRYTTWGPVRGDCGHLHYDLMGAKNCIDRDMKGCKSQGGYSDRHIRVLKMEPTATLASYDTTKGPGEAY